MSPPSKQNEVDKLIKELEHTAAQVSQVLDELVDTKVDLAQLKTEVKFILDNIKELSKLVRDGNHGTSLLTRIAVLEKSVENINIYIDKDTTGGAELSTRVAILENKIETIQKTINYQPTKAPKKAEGMDNKTKIIIAIITTTITVIGTILVAVL